jgi:hypothetical protein
VIKKDGLNFVRLYIAVPDIGGHLAEKCCKISCERINVGIKVFLVVALIVWNPVKMLVMK